MERFDIPKWEGVRGQRYVYARGRILTRFENRPPTIKKSGWRQKLPSSAIKNANPLQHTPQQIRRKIHQRKIPKQSK